MQRPVVLALLLALAALCPTRAAEPARDARENDPLDQSVARALAFLANTQDKNDGSWRGMSGRDPAVTGLCVMAFLSAGHVPGEGKYGAVVEKGIRYVAKTQQPNGLFADNNGHEMYQHGICTLMLAEAAGMTDGQLGEEIRKRLEKAVAIILKAQRTGPGEERGGWRYTVQHTGGSDMSVTGWQVMALRACKNLGCDVPAPAVDRAVDYIKRSQEKRSGAFCYTPQGGPTVPCTGTGVLALELCGKDRHHSPEALKAGYYLIKQENLPRWNSAYFYYSNYYGSQATFQLGGNYWSAYRPRLHEVLFRNQKANGSWDGGGTDAGYGPNYRTAMAVLALTVEYRYLPIYQREEPSDEKK